MQEDNLRNALKELIREVILDSFTIDENRSSEENTHRGSVKHPENDKRLKENRIYKDQAS